MGPRRKRPRRKVRCSMCTDARVGNSEKSMGRRPRAGRKFWPPAEGC